MIPNHFRHSMRLDGYDYSLARAYFITSITHWREPLFGEITTGIMVCNEFGKLLETEWYRLAPTTNKNLIRDNNWHL
jgi:putative transposase